MKILPFYKNNYWNKNKILKNINNKILWIKKCHNFNNNNRCHNRIILTCNTLIKVITLIIIINKCQWICKILEMKITNNKTLINKVIWTFLIVNKIIALMKIKKKLWQMYRTV